MQLNIISFHGLYSQGNNLEILVNALEFEAEARGYDVAASQHDYPVLKIRQGRKKWARDMVREFILKCLALEYRKFPEARLVVLCHSNATFGIMNALDRYSANRHLYDKIRIDTLLLFGCVMPRDFMWARYPLISVTNFVGSKDIVSSMSRFYGMGNAGQKGFVHAASNLTQVYTDWKHSDFVKEVNFNLIKAEFFGDL